ncbi:unnamed protein product [Amoebophrya sp. A25]|nr:unnamed protein product [Amoebophrya sp. A25]|eukprot:GSA25T00020270001.1
MKEPCSFPGGSTARVITSSLSSGKNDPFEKNTSMFCVRCCRLSGERSAAARLAKHLHLVITRMTMTPMIEKNRSRSSIKQLEDRLKNLRSSSIKQLTASRLQQSFSL